MATIGTVTVTTRTSLSAITVAGSGGNFLRFEVRAAGAVPLFAFASVDTAGAQHNLNDATQFPGHPLPTYTWRLRPRGAHNAPPADVVATDVREEYGLALAWSGVTTYDIKTEEINGAGAVVRTVKDMTLQSNDPTAAFDIVLKVTWT